MTHPDESITDWTDLDWTMTPYMSQAMGSLISATWSLARNPPWSPSNRDQTLLELGDELHDLAMRYYYEVDGPWLVDGRVVNSDCAIRAGLAEPGLRSRVLALVERMEETGIPGLQMPPEERDVLGLWA